MLRDEGSQGAHHGHRVTAVTPIVLVVGADGALAELARTLADAGYPVNDVPQARPLAGLTAGAALGPVVVDLAACGTTITG